jgi:hypothetical protein
MKNLKILFGRKNTVNSSFVLLWAAAAFCFLLSGQGICLLSPAAHATLVIYPAPSGAAMASGVTVTANGQSVPVYSFPIRPETPGQGGRFCQFDFSDSVTIFVSPVPKGTVVRPAFAHLNPVYTNGGVSITLRSPLNIHIVGVVAIFANPLEVNPPKQGDPGVVYYGPGMADAGTITLSSNQTLYLAGGAYVTGLVKADSANNVKIMGRGILYRKNGGLDGYGNPQIALDHCTDTLITGIVQLNAITHGWSGRHTESKGMKFVNFKNLGAADYSTDGNNIHNCSDVLYDNCFFICDDDNIAIKGFNYSKPCENITVQNSLLYNSNGTCITYGAESKASYYRNITVRNCDLYHDERYGGEPGKGAMAIQCRHGVRYSNLRYENITVNTNHNLINLFFTESLFTKNKNGDQSTPGEIDGVWFTNITATGTGSKSIVLQGWDSTKMVKNVQFSNLVIDNKPVTSLAEPYFKLNNFTENIKIVEGASQTVPKTSSEIPSRAIDTHIPKQVSIDSLGVAMGNIILLKEATGGAISIAMDTTSSQQRFGAILLETALREINRKPVRVSITAATGNEEITVQKVDSASNLAIKSEGFQITNAAGKIIIKAIDECGAMYGMQEVGDQIALNGLSGVPSKIVNARFSFRAIKVNLPWSAYRGYRKHPSHLVHVETMKDLKFWESFMDMMVENRFNALTIWNQHPFPYLIRATNFPKACSFTDAELAVWRDFWTKLFKMAKDRGIETYLVHWNIFVSKSYHDAYSPTALVDEEISTGPGVTNATDDRYLKESVTQLINEYPDLTGLGITLGEGMTGFSAQERQDWLERTEIAGMRAAKRKIKFIHRAPMYSTDAVVEGACRNTIDKITDAILPVKFEVKFNWSHGHSTPRLIKIHGGEPTGIYWSPTPTNYRVDWMVRNEDFYVLRWGQPDFIRQHIAMNGQNYVEGYFIGSENYMPAKDYIHVQNHPHINWSYAFERQWLFYKEWGRLLYDPSVPDKTFEMYVDRRYGKGTGAPLVKAYKLGSDMPLRFACMVDFHNDASLYAEGFGNPYFLSIRKLIDASVFDTTYYSVKDYVSDSLASKLNPAKITPLNLADTLQRNGQAALDLASGITGASTTLQCEIADVKTWGYLSLYFAHKLRAAVLLQYYTASGKKNAADKTNAIALLQSAKAEWANVVAMTKPHQQAIPLIPLGDTPFSWDSRSNDVNNDITTAQGF